MVSRPRTSAAGEAVRGAGCATCAGGGATNWARARRWRRNRRGERCRDRLLRRRRRGGSRHGARRRRLLVEPDARGRLLHRDLTGGRAAATFEVAAAAAPKAHAPAPRVARRRVGARDAGAPGERSRRAAIPASAPHRQRLAPSRRRLGRRRIGPGRCLLARDRRWRGDIVAGPVDTRQEGGRHHRSDARRHEHPSAAPTTARCRFVVTGGGAGGRRRTTAGGATSGAACTGAARGDSITRSDGARRVSGVMGEAATGVTTRSRARHQPAANDCAMAALREARRGHRHQRGVRPRSRRRGRARRAARVSGPWRPRRGRTTSPSPRRTGSPPPAGSDSASRQGCRCRSASRARASAAGRRAGRPRAPEEPRRLVVVFRLPADRQRRGEASREISENAKSMSASCSKRGGSRAPGASGSNVAGPNGNADVVALDVEVDELELVDHVERAQAMMRERPPVRAILEHVAQHAGRRARPEESSPIGRPSRRRRTSARAAGPRAPRSNCTTSGTQSMPWPMRRARMRHSRSVQWPKSPSRCVEEALGVAARLASAAPLRETPRRDRRSPSSGGRDRRRDRSGLGVMATSSSSAALRPRGAAIPTPSVGRPTSIAAIAWRASVAAVAPSMHDENGGVVLAAVAARGVDEAQAAAARAARRRAGNARRRSVDELVHAVAHEHEHLVAARVERARRSVRSRRRCRSCAPDRRASHPAAALRRDCDTCRRA